jgi:ParB family transcriptional regulator, chromosome partitioning protein
MSQTAVGTALSGATFPAQATSLPFVDEPASPVRKLDAASVQLSAWANRHEASFATPEFARFKEEIAASGGNIQPIKVRPLDGASDGALTAEPQFELIFGHRRHRACKELGLPVLALVEDATDLELFEQMERENRGRKNLSPWEQGHMYLKAHESKLYTSLRQMANRLGVDLATVSKSLQLARLPASVIAAFPSPLSIQFRWTTPLADAAKADPKGLRDRAQAIVKAAQGLSASAVFALLVNAPQAAQTSPEAAVNAANAAAGTNAEAAAETNAEATADINAEATKPSARAQSVQEVTVLNRSTPPTIHVLKSGQPAATLSTDEEGRAVLRFEAGVLGEARRAALMTMMEAFLSEV